MANTIGTPTNVHRGGPAQWTSLFDVAITFSATISDNDAISAGLTAAFSLTVPGARVGDLVIVSTDNDMVDADTAYVTVTGVVSAADTVSVRFRAGAAFNADDLNGTVVKGVCLRPVW